MLRRDLEARAIIATHLRSDGESRHFGRRGRGAVAAILLRWVGGFSHKPDEQVDAAAVPDPELHSDPRRQRQPDHHHLPEPGGVSAPRLEAVTPPGPRRGWIKDRCYWRWLLHPLGWL